MDALRRQFRQPGEVRRRTSAMYRPAQRSIPNECLWLGVERSQRERSWEEQVRIRWAQFPVPLRAVVVRVGGAQVEWCPRAR